jgi:(4S)-4-hydroxy-5-phosphonooxypentane-2,3-dione isomerase
MVVYNVSVSVKENYIEDFIKATELNHLSTRKEQGNIRFDVNQSEVNPCDFILYEVYQSVEAAAEHKKTEHYAKWRDRVAPFMDKPREGIRYNPLFPQSETEW